MNDDLIKESVENNIIYLNNEEGDVEIIDASIKKLVNANTIIGKCV